MKKTNGCSRTGPHKRDVIGTTMGHGPAGGEAGRPDERVGRVRRAGPAAGWPTRWIWRSTGATPGQIQIEARRRTRRGVEWRCVGQQERGRVKALERDDRSSSAFKQSEQGPATKDMARAAQRLGERRRARCVGIGGPCFGCPWRLAGSCPCRSPEWLGEEEVLRGEE